MYFDFNFLFFLVMLFLILTCGILYWCYRYYIRPYSGFPSFFFLAYLIKCVLFSRIPKNISIYHFFFQNHVDVCKKYQAEGMCLFWILQPYLYLYSEEAFKVFSNENTTINKPYSFNVFKEICMNSLLTSSKDLWKKRRKMINPVFYLPNLKDQVKLINKNARILVEDLQTHKSEASSNILKFLKVCSFKNVFEFLTGLDSAVEKNTHANKVIENIDKGAELILYRIIHPWMHPQCLLFLSSKGRSFLEVKKKLFEIVEKVLEKIKESFLFSIKIDKEAEEIFRNSRRTFAQVIFEQHAKDPTYTSTELQGEVIGMLSAGYDTVSHALMWSLFLLGHNSDAQEIAYEELKSVIGQNNEVSYDDLQNLKYLDCVIKEVLRIYPPVPIYGRRTVRDIQCGKHIVPKGTNILFSIYLRHRDPCLFPDPEKFDPERFLTGYSEEKLMTYTFAEGIRNCVGKKFALMELKIVLAHVIQNFKLTSLDRREDIMLSWEVVLTTTKPLRMCLTPRQHTSVQE